MQASTQLNTTERDKLVIPYRFLFLASFLVWLAGTVVMRLWGHKFFIPENNLSMGGSFLSLLFLPLLTYALFQWKQVQPQQCGDATVCLVIPSMLLDVVTTYYFTQVFPNLLPAASSMFGAWLLWGYALVLITGFFMGQKSKLQMV